MTATDADRRFGLSGKSMKRLAKAPPRAGKWIAAATLILLAAVEPAAAISGVVSGTVKEEGSGNPIPNVYVDIRDADGRVTIVETNGAGAFATDSLPEGEYYAMTVNYIGYIDELYNNVPFVCPPLSTSCTGYVDAGTPIPNNVDFRLEPGYRISGTVKRAETTIGMEGVWVDIYDDTGAWASDGVTDQTGEYISRTGLASGSYYARTWKTDGYYDQRYDPPEGLSCTGTCDVDRGDLIPVPSSDPVNFALYRLGEDPDLVLQKEIANPSSASCFSADNSITLGPEYGIASFKTVDFRTGPGSSCP